MRESIYARDIEDFIKNYEQLRFLKWDIYKTISFFQFDKTPFVKLDMFFIINKANVFAFIWHSDFSLHNPKRDNARFTTTLSLGIDSGIPNLIILSLVTKKYIADYHRTVKNKTLLFEGAATADLV